MEEDASAVVFLRTLGPTVLATVPDGFSLAQRRILARLALSAPYPVPVRALVEAAWDQAAPRTARQAVQNQISRIRRQAGDQVVVTVGESYVLGVPTDAQRIRDDSARAEQLLADGEAEQAFALADEVLGLWLGEPFADIGHLADVAPMRRALAAARAGAENTRLEAAIATGRRGWALYEAERLTGIAPHDERRALLHARALADNGRRADALAVIARIRRLLRTDLGIDVGAELAAVELEILRTTAEIGAGGLDAGPSSPFVGRDLDVRRVLVAVARERPALVRGEYGIGVSRLLAQVHARLTALGVRTVLVRAEENPYSAVGLIEQILDELDVRIRPGHSALSAFTDVLHTVTAELPWVLIVDDAHYLGPSTLAVLGEAVSAPNVRVVLGGQLSEVPFGDAIDVHLAPLNQAATGAIARYHGVTDPVRLAWLDLHSGGNPLALHALLDSVDTSDPQPQVDASVPALHTLVDRLTASLDAQQRHDLELAAVAGDGYPRAAFDGSGWAHRPQPPETLVEWVDGATLRFRHGAVRALLYERLPRGRVIDMHHALGTAARTIGAPPSIVAGHLLVAAEVDPNAATTAARAAAVAATRMGAHADAARWLNRAGAVAAGGDPRRALGLRIDYADALRLCGDPRHLDELLAATKDAFTLGDEEMITAACFALLQLGGSSAAGGLDRRIRSYSRRALSVIKDAERRAVVQAAASLAWSMTGNAGQCRRLFDEAEAGARSAAARLQVLPFGYLALGIPDDLSRREVLSTELIDIARAAGDPVGLFEGLHLRFSVALMRADGTSLRVSLAEMGELIDRVGDVGRRWALLYCSAALAHLDGDDAACERLAGEAHAMFARVSPARAASALYGQLLSLYLGRGCVAQLRPFVEALVVEQPGVPAWHAALALVLADSVCVGAQTGAGVGEVDSEAVLTHATRALELVQDDFLWLACHLIGARALTRLVEAEPAGGFDGTRWRGLAQRYRALLEPWAGLVCWQGTCSYGPVATVLALVARALGDATAAARYCAQAVELARGLAAPRYERELAELGFDVGTRAG